MRKSFQILGLIQGLIGISLTTIYGGLWFHVTPAQDGLWQAGVSLTALGAFYIAVAGIKFSAR